MSVVLDASIVLAWYFDDEGSPAADAVLEQVAASGAVVPSLWPLEVANGLQVAVRRKRIDSVYRDASLSKLALLGIVIDSDTATHAWRSTLALAGRHGLSVYDAAYLELAQRRRLPLATLDDALRTAGSVAGLTLLGAA